MKPDWRDNPNPEFHRRLTEWAKTSGVEAKEFAVRQLQQQGNYVRASALRAEVMEQARVAAQQIMRELNGADSKKRT